MYKRMVFFISIMSLLAGICLLTVFYLRVSPAGAARLPGDLTAVDAQGTPVMLPPPLFDEARVDDNNAYQRVNRMLVSLTLDPYPPTTSMPGNFEVVLTTPDKQPVSGATVRLNLAMPVLHHSLDPLDLAEVEPGTYQASARFTHTGQWRIEVIITIDGKTRTVFFDVWL